VIGGGMPVGAFGGRRDIMQHIAPLGPVYQAGTLSGNPVAMAAGMKTLELIAADAFYDELKYKVGILTGGLRDKARSIGIPFSTNSVGGMFGLFFTEDEKISNFEQVMRCDAERFKKFFHGMLEQGVYLAPSAYEAGFVSAAHSEDDLRYTLAAAEKVMQRL
jgi:glutamate-1-semialdehyde 2,1-aminomutase